MKQENNVNEHLQLKLRKSLKMNKDFYDIGEENPYFGYQNQIQDQNQLLYMQ